MSRADGLFRTRMYGFLVAMVFVAVLLLLTPESAYAETTFTVNSIGDSRDANFFDGVCDVDTATPGGQCTLRAAIEAANVAETSSTINFAIPGNGPHTIAPTSPLPLITNHRTTIDAYSESLDESTPASPNTATDGTTNAVLRIELSGTSVDPPASVNEVVLHIVAHDVVVKGLAINGWAARDGVSVNGNNNRIEGNFIGTDPSGTQDRGNGHNGVINESGRGNIIGGTAPAARNLISGNDSDGISITQISSGIKVQGNLIGTQKDGASALGNSDDGVRISAPNNTIGGTTPEEANIIAFNAGDGVVILGGNDITGNRLFGNSIFSNGQEGIDLSGDGRTANDPRDPDTGPNNLQNFPDLASATVSGGQLTITGNLNSTPSIKRSIRRKGKIRRRIIRRVFTVQFFSSPSTEDEGKTFLSQQVVATNLFGNAPINLTFAPAQPVSAGERITATATRNSTGDTSEFSNAIAVQ